MVESSATERATAYLLRRDTLLVQGPDRKTWLDGLVTCSMSAVGAGSGAYGLLLSKQGKIVTDLFLIDDGRTLFIGIAPGRGGEVGELLDRYLVMEDAELQTPEPPLSWQMLVGENASALAAQASGLVSAWGGLSLASFAAVVLVLPASAQAQLASQLGSEPLGERELSGVLAQHGMGVFGVDFGERDNPHEASLDRLAISWTKGCYLGQEVVCMQDMRGKVKRRLVLLEADLAAANTELSGAEVIEQGSGSVAGRVTSAHAQASGSTRLLASVSTPALEAGSELSVGGARVRVVQTGMARVE